MIIYVGSFNPDTLGTPSHSWFLMDVYSSGQDTSGLKVLEKMGVNRGSTERCGKTSLGKPFKREWSRSGGFSTIVLQEGNSAPNHILCDRKNSLNYEKQRVQTVKHGDFSPWEIGISWNFTIKNRHAADEQSGMCMCERVCVWKWRNPRLFLQKWHWCSRACTAHFIAGILIYPLII